MSRKTITLDRNNKLTCKGGLVIPIMTEHLIPGDVMKGKADILVRVAPQVAPLMDSVSVKTYFFYMPYRLFFKDDNEWTEWYSKQGKAYFDGDYKFSEFGKKVSNFFNERTEEDSSAEYLNKNFSVDKKFPHCRVGLPYFLKYVDEFLSRAGKNYVEQAVENSYLFDNGGSGSTLLYTEIGSLADYFGIPAGQTRYGLEFSPFPFEMYRHIYNEYFRDVLKYDEVKTDFYTYNQIFAQGSYEKGKADNWYVDHGAPPVSVFENIPVSSDNSFATSAMGNVSVRGVGSTGAEKQMVYWKDIVFPDHVRVGDGEEEMMSEETVLKVFDAWLGTFNQHLKMYDGYYEATTTLYSEPIEKSELLSLYYKTRNEYPVIDPVLFMQAYGTDRVDAYKLFDNQVGVNQFKETFGEVRTHLSENWVSLGSNCLVYNSNHSAYPEINSLYDATLGSTNRYSSLSRFVVSPNYAAVQATKSEIGVSYNSGTSSTLPYFSISPVGGSTVNSGSSSYLFNADFVTNLNKINSKGDLVYLACRMNNFDYEELPEFYKKLSHNYNMYNNLFYKSSQKDVWTNCLTDPSYYGFKFVVPVSTHGQFLDSEYSSAFDNTNGKIPLNNSGLDLSLVRMYTRIGVFFNYLANVGDRYEDQIEFIYGVRPSDLRMRKPAYVGGGKSRILFSEVVSTSPGDEKSGQGVKQGKASGYGFGLSRSHGFEVYAKEHGLVMGLMCIVPNGHNYAGLPNSLRIPKSYYDIPNPYFTHMEQTEVFVRDFLPSKFGGLYNSKHSVDTGGVYRGYTESVLSTGARSDFIQWCADNLKTTGLQRVDVLALYHYYNGKERFEVDQTDYDDVYTSISGTYLEDNVYSKTFGYQKQWYNWKTSLNEVHGEYLTNKRDNHLTRFFNEVFPCKYGDEDISFRGNYIRPVAQSLFDDFDTTMPGLNSFIFNSLDPVFNLGTFSHPFWCDINFKITCSRVGV